MLLAVRRTSFDAQAPSPIELTSVPIRRSTNAVDRHRLKETGNVEILVADPAEEILSIGEGLDASAVLLGEAGFGKTTAVKRVERSTERRVFIVRAAGLTGEAVNTRNSLLQ